MTLNVLSDVDLSLRQFVEAWRTMCAGAPGTVMEATGGVEYIFSGTPISFFNVAIVTARGVSADMLAAYGREACAWAADKPVPWLFVMTHERLDGDLDATAVLDSCGLAPVMSLTGMVAEDVAPPASLPPALVLSVPGDTASLGTLVDVNGAAYGMDLSAGKALIGTPSFWTRHFPVLATVDDAPVATAAVLMVEGLRYVALVATQPACQRRGYADAAMRQALEHSAAVHGHCTTVLHATDAGRPVYARMGYRSVSTHTLFMEKRFLTDH